MPFSPVLPLETLGCILQPTSPVSKEDVSCNKHLEMSIPREELGSLSPSNIHSRRRGPLCLKSYRLLTPPPSLRPRSLGSLLRLRTISHQFTILIPERGVTYVSSTLPYPVLLYTPALPCPALPCPALPCPALPYSTTYHMGEFVATGPSPRMPWN